MIENTGNRDPLLHLLGAMSDGSDKYITDMESAGQRQLVNSTQLPTRGSESLADMGFVLGEVNPDDKLFRTATLPDGWKKQGSDHAMWSHIVDHLGRQRVAIFYKAAWYDRDAFCRIETPNSYVWSLAYEGGTPVVDDEWATPAALTEAANDLMENERETVALYSRSDVADRDSKYAAERIAESNKRIAWAEALIAEVNR